MADNKKIPMMTAGDAISKSPLNTSKSKQLYSFNRAPRFTDVRKKQTSEELYDISNWKTNRSTSFGYGTKYDFTKENRDKCQSIYNTSTDFDPKKSSAPAYSMGLGRTYFDKVYYESNKMIDKSIPGPGIYNYQKPFGSGSSKFSMSFRYPDKSMEGNLKNPGPGQYKNMSINPKGKYVLSQYGNTPGVNFTDNKEKRFDYSNRHHNYPGPGQYDLKWLITGKGFNYISKYPSVPCPTIIGERRPDVTTKLTCYKSKLFFLNF
jgi:hypothetical protein